MNKTVTNDYSNNSVFLDKLSKINGVAKRKGFINARTWLVEAKKIGEVSSEEFDAFQSCHFLRNIIAHGGGTQLIITEQSIELADEFLARITNSSLAPRAGAAVPAPVPASVPERVVEEEQSKTDNSENALSVMDRVKRLKIIDDPSRKDVIEAKKSLAEGLRSMSNYAKSSKTEIDKIVVDMLARMSQAEFEEFLRDFEPITPPDLTQVKKEADSNLTNNYDLITREVCEGLNNILIRRKYIKRANEIFDIAKAAIKNAKSIKEVDAVYSKAIKDLQTLEPF